jgi:hypothetical protein
MVMVPVAKSHSSMGAPLWLVLALLFAAQGQCAPAQFDKPSPLAGSARVLYHKNSWLWLMNDDGTAKQQLPNTAEAGDAVCTPDGRRILLWVPEILSAFFRKFCPV